jgi:hypothetical protein
VILAVHALGEGLLGLGRAAVAAFSVGLLVTFLFVRMNTRLIRAKVSWWFHNIEPEGGPHVHHTVIGVVLVVVAGVSLIALLPQGLWLQLAALVFGAGVALTLDEFALILRLQDVYWMNEGRLSVDAVLVVVCARAPRRCDVARVAYGLLRPRRREAASSSASAAATGPSAGVSEDGADESG